MPEGDTVYLAAHRLHQALAGRELVRADLRVPRLATVDLTGGTVTEVVPRGKHLLMRIERDGARRTLHSHLRMDGRWDISKAGERWRGGPAFQVRAVLGNSRYTAVGYRLPVLELLDTAEEEQAVGHLGPDLLGPGWGPEAAAEAVRRLASRPERALGAALLDQRNLAGIGNVYRVELCFLRGVTPWIPVGELSEADLARTVALGRRLLWANRLRHGHVTTGDTRPGRRHWIYGRDRTGCGRCGGPVSTTPPGADPEDRVTYWCTHCQRGPSPTA
ncbi:DNA-formamidopyrimidine glycosylase family protein [Phaeacidiphilus oryzae]|uniref:DNA-formamidopyrimidine glycosylase family protein n=1 Tax=Phaeacidiphilus oryzae TaxID=348818 RepID=UPI000567FD44|nr:DNA-formamidopyrimidine glycosylase family protein [Phaeacidiphilus oryzae]